MKTIRLKDGAEMCVLSADSSVFRDPISQTFYLIPPAILCFGYLGIGLVWLGIIGNGLVVSVGSAVIGILVAFGVGALLRGEEADRKALLGAPDTAVPASARVQIAKSAIDVGGFFWVEDGVAHFRAEEFGFEMTREQWSPSFNGSAIEGPFLEPASYQMDSISVRSTIKSYGDFVSCLPEWEASFQSGPDTQAVPVYPPLTPRTPLQVLAQDGPFGLLFFGLTTLAIAWVEFEIVRHTGLSIPYPLWICPIATAVGMTIGAMIRSAVATRQARVRAVEIGAQQ